MTITAQRPIPASVKTPQGPPHPGTLQRRNGRPPAGRVRRLTDVWARRLHVYTSMIALLLVLFFGITGITLNHPEWTFGDDVSVTTHGGEFPFPATSEDRVVQFLAIAEYVRNDHGVVGSVDSYDVVDGQGSIAFKNPGYSADLFFDPGNNTYELTITQQGFVAVMNDLHKGRDSGSLWKWVIDISAGFLVAISITGLMMQFFLRRRRFAAFATAAVGCLITGILIMVTLS
ncbi:PepSY-associated TM helix domain-containing protein [Candidatus Poriferisocius sp.]|uniref:PepSY-associated TM helix domain-containing protein n=1 Tax=Candidatus Poriferisocius sp. TaxID=3101276 RepID=UPI003B59BE99